jgi:hypothetical protein
MEELVVIEGKGMRFTGSLWCCCGQLMAARPWLNIGAARKGPADIIPNGTPILCWWGVA